MKRPTNRHTSVIHKKEDQLSTDSRLRSLIFVAVCFVLLLLGGVMLFWTTNDNASSPANEVTGEVEIQPDFQPELQRNKEVSVGTGKEANAPGREDRPAAVNAGSGKKIENNMGRGPLGETVDEDSKRQWREEPSKGTPDSLEGLFPRDINDEMPEGTWPRGGLLSLPSVKPPFEWQRLDHSKTLTRIAVGSCLSQLLPQPIWDDVLDLRPLPDLFLMIGDNVYGDIKSSDFSELIEAYRMQGRHHGFSKAGRSFPFLAMWDDHDFGCNDAGEEFPHKAAAAKFFSDFWQIDTGRAAGEGIYYSRMIGPPGQRVHIIMLDTRSFRSALTLMNSRLPYWGKYQPEFDPERTMLGDRQWSWFEDEVKRSAELRLIVSSVQVLAGGHGFERWGNLPRELDRLLKMLSVSNNVPTIVLSGDRHMGAFYRVQLSNSRALLEVTTSSLNRSYGPSKDVIGPELVSPFFHRENFALLDIDWERKSLKLSLRGLQGEIFHVINTPFSRLEGRQGILSRDAR